MTSPEHDYEDILRHALRAAAESVEPAADGLDRIRGRLSAPRFSPFVLLTEFLYWFRPFLTRIESGTAGVRSGLQALAIRTQVADRIRLRSRLGPAFTRLAPAATWLRPVLAVAGAVAIVVVGVFALGQAQQFITPTNQVTHPGVAHSPQRATPTPPAGTQPIWVNQSATPTSTTGSSPGARTASSCPPSPKASATVVAPASSPVATPTPTPTATATPTDSPTPTVSPTSTSVAGASAASASEGEVATVSAKKILVPCASASTAKVP